MAKELPSQVKPLTEREIALAGGADIDDVQVDPSVEPLIDGELDSALDSSDVDDDDTTKKPDLEVAVVSGEDRSPELAGEGEYIDEPEETSGDEEGDQPVVAKDGDAPDGEQPAQKTLSQDEVELAYSYGLTDENIRGMTPDSFHQIATIIEQRDRQLFSSEAPIQQPAPQTNLGEAPPANTNWPGPFPQSPLPQQQPAAQGAFPPAGYQQSQGEPEQHLIAPQPNELSQVKLDDGPGVKDGKLDVDYYKKNNFDEATVAAVQALRLQQDQAEQQQSLLRQHQQMLAGQQRDMELFVQQQAVEEHRRQANDFHDAVDTIRPDFYGNSLNEDGSTRRLTNEQADRRERLGAAVREIEQTIRMQNQLAGRNQSIPSYAVLVRRAEQVVFGKELSEKATAEQAKKLRAQSHRRRPVSRSAGTKAVNPKASQDLTAAEIASLPQVASYWQEAQEANGLS
ncbi:MAG: hypothetical protein AAGB04_00125 [Pseudomonadota bacterium]